MFSGDRYERNLQFGSLAVQTVVNGVVFCFSARSSKAVMLFARRHALSTALILSIAGFVNGQDFRYQTYNNNYPPQTVYDRNQQQLPNAYNPQLNQYGQQNDYPNRPVYNQPLGRPGTPSYRSNIGYNSPVSIQFCFDYSDITFVRNLCYVRFQTDLLNVYRFTG